MDIESANTEATQRMMEARPVVVGMGKAIDVIPGMRDNLLLHAGPPITWERMSGPLKGAVIGALAVGPGDGEGIEMGPLVTRQHLDKVKGYIDLGVSEGATLAVDGRGRLTLHFALRDLRQPLHHLDEAVQGAGR